MSWPYYLLAVTIASLVLVGRWITEGADMSEKKKYGQIFMDGVPGYCLPLAMFGELTHELESCEVGAGFQVNVIEMTDEEHDNAPEFEGW